jgi:hypothetical protein
VTTLDIGLTAAFVLVMILVAGAGVLQALIATTTMAYFVYPRIMVGEVATDGYFIGISWSHAVVLTWYVAIAFAFIYGAIRRKGLGLANLWPVVPLVVFSTIFFSIGWAQSRALTAGFLHLLTVSASWAVGYVLFSAVHSTRDGERVLSKWIAGVASFIALVCILQVSGFDINSNSTKLLRSAAGARDTIAGVRVVSTFNEPTAAGKFLFLLAIIAVVWLFGRDAQKRRNSIVMVAAILVVSLLTQTRSNFAAFGALLLLYSLVVTRRNLFTRVAFTGISAAVVIFASFYTWVARFAEGGGIRGHTLEVAIDYIASNPDTLWAGIGPNRYFEVLAPLDSWVARGYPPHNYFIYLLVELGVLGTLCYVLPFVVLTVSSAKAIRNGSHNFGLAKAWLCSLPGLLLIAMLGWGLLSVVAPALFLVMGYIYASLSQSARNEFQLGDARRRAAGVERNRENPRALLR